MGGPDTIDTYEADDSILNPSGKVEHMEVTEPREVGTITIMLNQCPPSLISIEPSLTYCLAIAFVFSS